MKTKLKWLLMSLVSGFFGALVAIALLNDSDSQRPAAPSSSDNAPRFPSWRNAPDTTRMVAPAGLNFIYAANRSTASVVHIRTTYENAQRRPNDFEEFFRDFFRESPSRPSRAAGSGVILSEDGFIVTNNHVVADANSIEVLLSDNRSFQGKVIGLDPTTDLAVLKIDATGLSAMTLGDSERLQIGEWVLAIGNPYRFRSTVTAGIVSAKARNINILARNNRGPNLQIESFIQTDAAINPGNSGGALVNLNGELVGINTAIISTTGAYSGYSFAVPVSLVRKVYEDLVGYGAVQRALLGIHIRDLTSELAREKGIELVSGVFVAGVNQAGAAQEAGIEQGDVIVSVNGKSVSSVSELQEQVALKRPGDSVEVSYIRDGKARKTKATLKNILGDTSIVASINDRFQDQGASFIPLADEDKSRLQIEEGVKVEQVEEGRWKKAGIEKGFVITSINRSPVADLQELRLAVGSSEGQGILVEGKYESTEVRFYGVEG